MKRVLIILLHVTYPTLFLYNIKSRDYCVLDKRYFAEIAKELRNNFIMHHLNGALYGEKPLLFYYIAYISQKIFFFVK